MLEMFDRALAGNGYRILKPSEGENGYRIYLDIEKGLVNAVVFVEAKMYHHSYMSQFKASLNEKMGRINSNVHYMTVVVVDSAGEDYIEELSIARQVCEESSFAWIYDVANKSLIINENQAENFYGLKEVIENADFTPIGVIEDKIAKPSGSWWSDLKDAIKRMPKFTTVMVILNVIVFIICTFTGTLLYNKGCVGLKLITSPSQIYRVITSMFLHADITHLFSNMMLLYFLGEVVEQEMGTIPFGICYFFAGVWGCLITFVSEIISGDYIIMVGASGAVFGILGALLALVMFRRINKETMHFGRVLVVIIFSVYSGFQDTNVAGWAHLGGLVAGFLAAITYCILTNGKRKSTDYASDHMKRNGDRNED